MKLLVFGKTGQVARELQRLNPHAIFLGRDECDLSDTRACAQVLRESTVDAAINAAAYTAVDQAETDADAAFAVNAVAPSVMAQVAAEEGIPLVHVSTDYVFDGQGERPWQPHDSTAPLGVYGQSKLAGEEGVRAAQGQHAIIRTSWVFSSHGANFVKTMLRLGDERNTLNVVADQIGGPTPARSLASALLRMAEYLAGKKVSSGTWHLSGAPEVSWADFAREIFAQAQIDCHINDIPSEDYPSPTPRPVNSRLDCATIADEFGIDRPDWRTGLAEVLKEIGRARDDNA